MNMLREWEQVSKEKGAKMLVKREREREREERGRERETERVREGKKRGEFEKKDQQWRKLNIERREDK